MPAVQILKKEGLNSDGMRLTRIPFASVRPDLS